MDSAARHGVELTGEGEDTPRMAPHGGGVERGTSLRKFSSPKKFYLPRIVKRGGRWLCSMAREPGGGFGHSPVAAYYAWVRWA